MGVSHVGSAAANGTSVTLPTHQAGDLIVLWACRDEGGSVAIPCAEGWAPIAHVPLGSAGSAILACKIARSAAETSGAWISAEGVSVLVFRGGKLARPVGTFDILNGASANMTYRTITPVMSDSSSWVAAFGYFAGTESGGDDAPTGMTQRVTQVCNTSHTICAHDTNGGVNAWSQQTVAIGATRRTFTAVIEIIESAAVVDERFVNSAASGANDGTSKTDAWTSLASATGVRPGTKIKIDDGHNQNPGASGTYNFTGGTQAWPVEIYFVDFATDAYSPAASANFSGASSDLIIGGFVAVHGLYNGVADDTTISDTFTAGSRSQAYIDCTFAGGDDLIIQCQFGQMEFDGCSFVHAAGTVQSNRCEDGAHVIYKNCAWSGTAGSLTVSGEGGHLIFDCCDLSMFASLLTATTLGVSVSLRKCKLHADALATIGSGTIERQSDQITVENCDDGTITVPPIGLNKYVTYWGTVQSDGTRYRTGGATDGLQSTAYSWAMATNAKSLEAVNWIEGRPLTAFVEPDASISGATGRGIYTTAKIEPLASPAALTTDNASTWNGASGTELDVKQKITVALTNGQTLTVRVASAATLNDDDFWIKATEPDQVGGPVLITPCLAKPSTTVYVDPQVEVA